MKDNNFKIFIPLEVTNSNLELIKWLSKKENTDEFIIDTLNNEMKKENQRNTFTKDELNEISTNTKELFGSKKEKSKLSSKDLEELFRDDDFWNS